MKERPTMMSPDQRATQISQVIPKLQQVSVGDADYRVPETGLLIRLAGPEPDLLKPVSDHITDLFQVAFKVTVESELDEAPDYSLSIGSPSHLAGAGVPDSLGPEGYHLQVSEDGVSAKTKSATAIRWAGITTFFLTASSEDGLFVAGCDVIDQPRYAWRGFMLDKGRSPNSVNKIKWMIDFCALYKLNRLLLREGDDELNGVRYDTLPLGAENPFALTMSDVTELIDYANSRGIVIVPEIECLGHSQAKALHYPDLVSGGFPQAYRDIATHIRKSHLEPCNPETYQLLAAMTREWLNKTVTGELHIGMDEVRLPGDIQAEHMAGLLPALKQVADELGVDFKPIVWADAPATPPSWQDTVIRCPWAYAEHNNLGGRQLERQGVPGLLKEGCTEQVIMAGGSGSYHRPYAKNGVEVAVKNLLKWARLGNDHPNFIGLLAVQWSGNRLEQWQQDFIAAADFSWNPDQEEDYNLGAFEHRTARQIDFIESFYPPVNEDADRSCWNGIWVKQGRYVQDFVRDCQENATKVK